MFAKNTLDYFRKALTRELIRAGFSRKHARAAAETFRYTGESLLHDHSLPEDDVLIDLAVDHYKVHKELPAYTSGPVGGHPDNMSWATVFNKLKEERRPTIRQMVLAYELDAEQYDLLKKTSIPILLLPTDRRIAEAALHYKILHGRLPDKASGFFYEEKSHWQWGTILDRLRKERNVTLGQLVQDHLQKVEKRSDVANGKSYRTTSHFPDNEKIAKAAIRYRKDHGKLPTKAAGPANIKKCLISWRTIHETLADEQRTTLSVIVRDYERALEKAREESLIPKEGEISARTIFRDSAAFLMSEQKIPDPACGDRIAGKSIKHLNIYFRENAVAGYRLYLLPATPVPKNLNDFLVFSGMAERDGKTVRPASPETIRQLVEEHHPVYT